MNVALRFWEDHSDDLQNFSAPNVIGIVISKKQKKIDNCNILYIPVEPFSDELNILWRKHAKDILINVSKNLKEPVPVLLEHDCGFCLKDDIECSTQASILKNFYFIYKNSDLFVKLLK